MLPQEWYVKDESIAFVKLVGEIKLDEIKSMTFLRLFLIWFVCFKVGIQFSPPDLFWATLQRQLLSQLSLEPRRREIGSHGMPQTGISWKSLLWISYENPSLYVQIRSKPCCHVLVLVVIRELVHVLHDLVDAHPEEVANGGKHPARHLAESLPCPGKLIKNGSRIS